MFNRVTQRLIGRLTSSTGGSIHQGDAAQTGIEVVANSVTDFEALLGRFVEQRSRQAVRFTFDDYPQYSLAQAFTLARLGRPDEARDAFGEWASRRKLAPRVRTRLDELLAAAGPAQ